jgi:very-short-patch-repair endonuclease
MHGKKLPQDSQKLNSPHDLSIALNSAPEPSYIEDQLAAAFDSIGLSYERQYVINGRYVDFAFPEAQLIVECDGYAYHHTKEDRERDTSRDNDFAILGWEVRRFTGSRINAHALSCACVVKYVYDIRIQMLNLALSKALCGEYAFPQTILQ